MRNKLKKIKQLLWPIVIIKLIIKLSIIYVMLFTFENCTTKKYKPHKPVPCPCEKK